MPTRKVKSAPPKISTTRLRLNPKIPRSIEKHWNILPSNLQTAVINTHKSYVKKLNSAAKAIQRSHRNPSQRQQNISNRMRKEWLQRHPQVQLQAQLQAQNGLPVPPGLALGGIPIFNPANVPTRSITRRQLMIRPKLRKGTRPKSI